MATKAQSILVGGLNHTEAPEWVKATVFCMVSGDDQMAMQMVEFIADHRETTAEELLDEARRISGE